MGDDKSVQTGAEGDDQSEEIPFDPLLAQAERLPASIKGSEGEKAHVLPADGEEGVISEVPVSEDEEELGGSSVDPKDFTADS